MNELALISASLRARLQPATEQPPSATNIRQAAVALILREHVGLAELLLIKRAPNPRDFWSGHLALPGGRWQSEDADLVATAQRETHEEVGIDLTMGGEILGRLNTIGPSSPRVPPLAVTPFIALAPPAYQIATPAQPEPALQIQPSEVAAAFWVSISFLKKDGRSEVVRHMIEGHKYKWPAYASIHGPVWGLTERILTQFLGLIA